MINTIYDKKDSIKLYLVSSVTHSKLTGGKNIVLHTNVSFKNKLACPIEIKFINNDQAAVLEHHIYEDSSH